MNMTLETKPAHRKIPLVYKFISELRDFDLSDVLIICVQHLFLSTYYMFESLLDVGLKPENLFILGKCYSTDMRAFSKFKEMGAFVSSRSHFYNGHEPYDHTLLSAAESLLDEVLNKKDLSEFRKIIILDDGGDLLGLANDKLPHLDNFIGIEQTASGYNRVKENLPFFSVINLARSWAKLQHETPIIIKSISSQMLNKLREYKHKVKNVLIIGYGSLGQSIHQNLISIFRVDFFDPKFKDILGLKNLHKNLNKYDLIIGCTGATSLPGIYHKLLKKGVILASTSSSDREFDGVHLRKLLPPNDDCHADMEINGITLLNSGFPINFTPNYDESDTLEFQLTRALIVASIYQAVVQKPINKGFVDLDSALQDKILQEHLNV